MKIDERHLIQLAAVVKTGGVTEGAALLGLAQSAVSRTLSMLEKRVGEPLFIKGRRPLQPTAFGLALAGPNERMARNRERQEYAGAFGGAPLMRINRTEPPLRNHLAS